ncbi:ATP-binding cassette domain-containing protein [Deinococcus metallilatus]|uniref:ATP-binding cassette domain-containing protein n=1 Tax=Deinococcus metallilatus TaxID=1211322 RepID=A0AAJ5JYP6_9DEIO|nr:ATP-binding cassette domain-containing protein [Deinococcus metallilatus]MBB5294752.1 molybdate transport system ATP-binding protein [Deinococcus metallilatus]QBY09520.1 ATP-binding cassette domain-containing protein [Deinococcus metallilatus]RXJ09525.1 ATP-binding cassette domain-containing protein [Deinococcus metallilatus]TLK29047.1 ATP-binding cassette domain-containing protein [Deinococcus metallilatus]
MTLPLVELRNATVRAGGRTLLESVSLTLAPGEALRLAGPNGGGKTTLLRLLSGEVTPAQGQRVYGLGGSLQRSAVRARRTLSVVGPDAEAFYLTRDWAQTVRDVLLAGFEGDALRLWEPTPEALARLAEVAALTDVMGLLERDFRTLSHGQRRRAVLARALMPRPEALLLDEFTDGLSAGARERLGRVVRDIHASGVAVVLATHRPEEAPLPWRTLWVEGGRVVAGQTTAPPPTGAVHLPPPPGSGDLVRLRDVEVYRNGHRALGPLSWTWAAGQHWLVTGENGSGKSTLARLIAGELHPALGGRIERPFLRRDRLTERRRLVGLVGAEVGIRQRRAWTGREVIGSAWGGSEGFSAELTPEQAARVEELAAHLHVTDLLDRRAETLSQGQLRRLLLARAVSHAPRLLMLDEGLDFLDAGARSRFLALLPELARQGTHVMVIAHRPSDAPPGLTHHLRLEGGRVAGAGPLPRRG